MASAAPVLRDTFEKANVANIAIVDDGYDPPLPGDLAEQQWEALRAAVDDGAAGAHADALAAAGDLPPYGDVRPPLAAGLYEHALAIQAAGPREVGADPVADELEALFRPFAGRKEAKRRDLAFVEQVARDATGKEPRRLPSRTPAADLAGYDLVFLDFFLGEETRDGSQDDDLLRAAREQARTIVRETARAVGAGRMPLFVLISSRADPDSAPPFRDEAELLASKFRFLTKGEFEVDRTKTEYVLAGLAMERDAGDAVERLLQEWKTSLHGAVGDLMTSVRRLDVTDYAYLQKNRLAEEKVSLLEYLTWLFNSYLGSFVEDRLSRSDAALVAPIANAPVPPATLQPMSEIPRIYSAVTTTRVRSFGDAAPAPIATGDLFVRKGLIDAARDLPKARAATAAIDAGVPAQTEGERVAKAAAAPAPDVAVADDVTPAEQAAGAGGGSEATPAPARAASTPPAARPDILATVTPICDIMPGREKALSVLLMGGTLTAPGRAKAASGHLLSVDRPGAAPGEAPLDFQIDWEKKWPVAHPLGSFDGQGILGTDYVRVGRLRDIYAADLAQQMSGDLSRVGLPIAPPFTHSLHVRVLIRVGRRVVRLFEAAPDEPTAWELYSRKSGERREAMIATDLIWKLRAAALAGVADGEECRAILCSPETLRPLTTAFVIKDKATPTPAGAKVLVVREADPPARDAIQQADAAVLIHLSGAHPSSG